MFQRTGTCTYLRPVLDERTALGSKEAFPGRVSAWRTASRFNQLEASVLVWQGIALFLDIAGPI